MKPELIELKMLRLESFDAEVDAEVMERTILPRQRELNNAAAVARLKEGGKKRAVERARKRYDEEQLALIGKAKSFRGERVKINVVKGYVMDIYPIDSD